MRGLKHVPLVVLDLYPVAPSRVRGLKLALALVFQLAFHVAPSRVRGLKQADIDQAYALNVAPSRVRGLKQLFETYENMEVSSHLHGCVD